MEFNKKSARMLSRMGPRPAYGQAVAELASCNQNIIALSADLGRSSGLDRFSKEYPSQFINTGIAEQNLVGCAAGLTRAGFRTYASTFAPFASMRASEQVRMNMGYMQEPVNLFALGSGLSLAYLGNSHFGLEDISIMRTIPGIDVVCPADCFEIFKVVQALENHDKPTYIRVTGAMNCPIVYEEDYDFNIGSAINILPIGEINVISNGAILGACKEAINEIIDDLGIKIGLYNFHSVNPLDTNALDKLAESSSKVIVFEEHLLSGGLGSSVIEYFSDNYLSFPKVHRFGIKHWIKETGTYQFMLKKLGLDKDGIKSSILQNL